MDDHIRGGEGGPEALEGQTAGRDSENNPTETRSINPQIGPPAARGKLFSTRTLPQPFTPREAPFWLTLIFAALSFPYALGVRIRNFFYDMGLLPVKKLPLKAVCVGNLTVGGTGKTPAVSWIARFFRARDIPVAILRRGYKRGSGTGPADETLLLMEQVPGVQVLESPNRVSGANRAAASGARLVVLDDGFQHRRARRDLDVVLVDAADPFGGGHLLPWGMLREPIQGLSRAHVVVLTRCDQASEATQEDLESRLKGLNLEAPVIRTAHAPRRLLEAAGGDTLDLKHLVGKKIRAFAGVARPEAFVRTLEDLGAHVERFHAFPDHHDYKAAEVESLMSRPGPTWITTEKDWVKIKGMLPEEPDLWILGIDLEILEGEELLERSLLAVLAEEGC